MAKLELYYTLCSRSRKAFRREFTRYGEPYYYSPRGDLLRRLSQETGDSIEKVRKQLLEERQFYLENNKNFKKAKSSNSK